jgi:GMP synthase (glutamine-hydrolysing)
MRILVLVAGQTVPTIARRRGDFPRWIRQQAGTAWPGERATHDIRVTGPLPDPRDADAFIITGSSSSVTERAPWMLRAEGLIRGIASTRTPLLGVCFGHQMIAQALGGEVSKNPRGREIGTVRVVRLADDPIFARLPRAFDVQATHVDTVTRLPPGAALLATTTLDPAAAFRVGTSVRAVQFHPEFDADVMRGYLQARGHLIAAEGQDPEALLAKVHDGTRGRDILQNFARWASGSRFASRAGRSTHSRWPLRDHLVFVGPGASVATIGSGAKSCGSTEGAGIASAAGSHFASGGAPSASLQQRKPTK